MSRILEPIIPFEHEKRLELEFLISEISSSLVNVPWDQVDEIIQQNLEKILLFLQIDRTTVWQSEGTKNRFVLTHFATRLGVPPLTRDLSTDLFPWCLGKILKGEEIRFSRIQDMPEQAEKDKQTFAAYGPKWSGLAIPMFENGQPFGAIGFGIASEKVWPEELVQRLRVVAHVLSNAIVRRKMEEKLHLTLDELHELKERLHQENVYLRGEAKISNYYGHIIGESSAMKGVLSKVEQVARTNATVLLLGETGTGKELIASAIHDHSDRMARPMVKVNCAAIPASLIESELFGREKGAYTGALTRQIGRFELADKSTIFLDEIADLTPETQVKLLRVLQEREIERLGNPTPIHIDVRIIAATHQNLEKAVRQGTFREDLYYRLNVFPIQIPPLREKREDILMLVWAFIDEFSTAFGKKIESVPVEVIEMLMNYSWPGNIRELRNIVERAMIVSSGPKLHIENPAGHELPSNPGLHSLRELEREHIKKVLRMTGWRIRGSNGAAQLLQIKPTTLETRMAKLGIVRPQR